MKNLTVMLEQIGNIYFQSKNSKLYASLLRISVLMIVSSLAFPLLSSVLPSPRAIFLPFWSFLGVLFHLCGSSLVSFLGVLFLPLWSFPLNAPCGFVGLPWFSPFWSFRGVLFSPLCSFVGAARLSSFLCVLFSPLCL